MTLPKPSQAGLLLSLALAAGMWNYVDGILIPFQKAQATEHGTPRGNLSDLYPRWLGARELLLHGRDPYSPEVTREIQTGYYGRPLDPARPGDPRDEQAFAYPAYVALLLAAVIRLPFPAVQAGFRWLLVVLTILSVLHWMRALGCRFSRAAVMIFVILTLGSFPALQGIRLQQLSVLVAALIAASIAALSAGGLVLSGVLLALASIKPQLVLPLALWLLLWACADWRRRQRWAWGFAATMLLLGLGAQVILPGWIGKFYAAVASYRRYAGGHSLLDVLVSPTGGMALSAFLLLLLAMRCWGLRNQPARTPGFALATCLVLAVTLAVIPMFAPYNQLLLLPGVMLLVQSSRGLWQRGAVMRGILCLSAGLVFWPWLATASLAGALWFFPLATVQRAWQLPLYTSLLIPLAVLAPLLLLEQAPPDGNPIAEG